MSSPYDPELYSAWTKVSKKRGRPPQEDNTREAKHSREDRYWLNPTSTSNRYSALSDENSPEHHQKSNIETTPRPPPIFVSNVTAMSQLIQLLEQTAKLQYEIKDLLGNRIIIQPKTPEAYRTFIKALEEKPQLFTRINPKMNVATE
jgi:hypothetical protein